MSFTAQLPLNKTNNGTYVNIDDQVNFIKQNVKNVLLTNPGERIGNPEFGGGLRDFIFSQINQQSTEFLKEDIQSKISREFPNVDVQELNVTNNPDNNEVSVAIFYAIIDTNIEDEVTLNFA